MCQSPSFAGKMDMSDFGDWDRATPKMFLACGANPNPYPESCPRKYGL